MVQSEREELIQQALDHLREHRSLRLVDCKNGEVWAFGFYGISSRQQCSVEDAVRQARVATAAAQEKMRIMLEGLSDGELEKGFDALIASTKAGSMGDMLITELLAAHPDWERVEYSK
jgi:hypothetical protein